MGKGLSQTELEVDVKLELQKTKRPNDNNNNNVVMLSTRKVIVYLSTPILACIVWTVVSSVSLLHDEASLVGVDSSPYPILSRVTSTLVESVAATAPTAPTQKKKKNKITDCRALPNGGPLSIVWAWSDPPAVPAMITTLQGAATALPGRQVVVHCGSTACLQAARYAATGQDCVWVSTLVAPTLAQNTPLEDWVGDHVLAKILSAHYYEETLQVVLQLVVLYKYGGVVLLAGLRPTPQLVDIGLDDTVWLKAPSFGLVRPGVGGGLYAAAAPPAHPHVTTYMTEMLAAYHIQYYVPTAWPIQIQWNNLCARTDECLTARVPLSDWGLQTEPDSPVQYRPRRHYGTLSYQARRHYLRSINNPGMNKGDEMQGLAGIQFLPRIDAFVERDRLDVVQVLGSVNFTASGPVTPHTKSMPATVPTTVFLNAWWGTPSWVWPPPGKLEPIFVSMHLNTDKVKEDVRKHRAYLQQHWPIGARDTKTQAFFESIGAHSVFSACMTMTLLPSWSSQRAAKERTDEILLVDVSAVGQKLLPPAIQSRALPLSAKMVDPQQVDDQVARYVEAHAMKIRLQKAKLVITQRLHVALPAASMGTPVILILDNNLPGGGGVAGLARFSGLQAAVHTVDAADTQNATAAMTRFNWDQPPPNPNPRIIRVRRNALRVLAMCHGEHILDSARKFGVVPASWEYPREEQVCSSDAAPHPDAIHIATAINPVWLDAKPILSSWIHALYQSNPQEKFVFYFLTGEVNPKQRCLVRWMVLRWFPDAVVYTIPMDKVLSDLPYIPIKHVPIVTQTRLFLPHLLSCVKRTLWIDTDAMVIKRLRPMWSNWEVMPSCGIVARSSVDKLSMGGMIGKLNKTRPFQLWKRVSYDKPGFNAGVMLLDLGILRKSNFTETVARYWSFDLGGNDQVSMNMQCNGTHGQLDSIWNVFMDYPKDPVHKRVDEWSIVHFQGERKPWVVERPSIQHYKIWNNYSLSLPDALLGPS